MGLATEKKNDPSHQMGLIPFLFSYNKIQLQIFIDPIYQLLFGL